MTPEESARWLVSHKEEFRRLDVVRCEHCTPRSAVAVLYAHKSGRTALWVAPTQELQQTGQMVRSPARLVPAQLGYTLLTQCPRCRSTLLLVVGDDGVISRWLGAPTRGEVAD